MKSNAVYVKFIRFATGETDVTGEERQWISGFSKRLGKLNSKVEIRLSEDGVSDDEQTTLNDMRYVARGIARVIAGRLGYNPKETALKMSVVLNIPGSIVQKIIAECPDTKNRASELLFAIYEHRWKDMTDPLSGEALGDICNMVPLVRLCLNMDTYTMDPETSTFLKAMVGILADCYDIRIDSDIQWIPFNLMMLCLRFCADPLCVKAAASVLKESVKWPLRQLQLREIYIVAVKEANDQCKRRMEGTFKGKRIVFPFYGEKEQGVIDTESLIVNIQEVLKGVDPTFRVEVDPVSLGLPTPAIIREVVIKAEQANEDEATSIPLFYMPLFFVKEEPSDPSIGDLLTEEKSSEIKTPILTEKNEENRGSWVAFFKTHNKAVVYAAFLAMCLDITLTELFKEFLAPDQELDTMLFSFLHLVVPNIRDEELKKRVQAFCMHHRSGVKLLQGLLLAMVGAKHTADGSTLDKQIDGEALTGFLSKLNWFHDKYTAKLVPGEKYSAEALVAQGNHIAGCQKLIRETFAMAIESARHIKDPYVRNV